MAAAGSVTIVFAGSGLSAGYNRLLPRREVDATELLFYAIVYLGVALFWMVAAVGISLLREWGWWTDLLTSLRPSLPEHIISLNLRLLGYPKPMAGGPRQAAGLPPLSAGVLSPGPMG